MKTKKSLGQHFLTSRSVVERMVRAADVTRADTVLEIGPGRGILTRALLERVGKVIAVEKDGALVAFLKETFAKEIKNKKLTLVHDDVLKIKISCKCKIVANIPYYITGVLIRKIFSSEHLPQSITLLVQKEIAERIARNAKESVLSLSVKAYGTPRYVATVKAGNFKPQPKVDSAILHVGNISRDFFNNGTSDVRRTSDVHTLEQRFFALIKTGFAHKRKKLVRNLAEPAKANVRSSTPNIEYWEGVFAKCGVPRDARAEDVPLLQWKCLAAWAK